MTFCVFFFFFFQAEDGIRDLVRSRGLGDVYKRQAQGREPVSDREAGAAERAPVAGVERDHHAVAVDLVRGLTGAPSVQVIAHCFGAFHSPEPDSIMVPKLVGEIPTRLDDAKSPVNVGLTQADALKYYLKDHPEFASKFINLGEIGKECVFIVTGKDSDLRSDSDLQQTLGQAIPADAPLQRGDLLFWKGHVAQAVDPARMIHATGHGMTTLIEDTEAAIARIIAQGGGPVIARRRL